MTNAPTPTAPTFSHVASRTDRRCKWWQKTINAEIAATLDPAAIEGGNSIPGEYLRDGADLELPAWTMILDSEQVHHAKPRGYSYTLGVIMPKADGSLGRTWIAGKVSAQKGAIKAAGATHLLGGSGDTAGLVRMARWILEAEGDEARLARIEVLKGA